MCEWLSCKEWCDVYLQCDGHIFRAHRVVLASVSNFLREALLSHSIEETPISIVLPEFDRHCVSSMLYYIYNGEITIQRSQLKMFLEIMNAMQICIDYTYLSNINDLVKDDNFDIRSHKGDLKSKVSHVMTNNKEGRINLKTRVDLHENLCNTIWESNHFNKDMPENVHYLNESFSDYLKSSHDHRQRQSLCRDLFIETCRLNGNSNGDVEGTLAITNEYYREPTSRHLTNANAGDLGTNHIVTKKSHMKEAEIMSTFKSKQKESKHFYLSAVMTQHFLESNEYISTWDKVIGPKILPNTSHIQNLTIDKETKTNQENPITRITILNEVMQSPWTPIMPNSYKPLRKKSNNNNLSVLSKPTECVKIFSDSESSESHEKQRSRYKCIECHKSFSQLRNFKYHLSVHRGTKEFATTCPVCGKYFNDKGYLSSHMKIHKNCKEYKCSICPKSFNQRVAYNMHMRIHTGVKPHVCEECGKAFSRKMLLKQHLRTHSGERPYACSHCDKRFADRSNMTLHLRLHTGVKPFVCSVCSKSFTKKHHLKSHLNFHTGFKPYSCPRCKLAFTQSSNMRTHLKKCTAFRSLLI